MTCQGFRDFFAFLVLLSRCTWEDRITNIICRVCLVPRTLPAAHNSHSPWGTRNLSWVQRFSFLYSTPECRLQHQLNRKGPDPGCSDHLLLQNSFTATTSYPGFPRGCLLHGPHKLGASPPPPPPPIIPRPIIFIILNAYALSYMVWEIACSAGYILSLIACKVEIYFLFFYVTQPQTH
jgi:hypothetical protein